MEQRYVVERGSGLTRMLWRVRALLTDTQTGDRLEVRTRRLAEDLQALLQDAEGQVEVLTADADASPFRRYESSSGDHGWHYLWRAEGALNHEAFARTKSESLARRVVDALNLADPRKLRDPHGPFKARWF